MTVMAHKKMTAEIHNRACKCNMNVCKAVDNDWNQTVLVMWPDIHIGGNTYQLQLSCNAVIVQR